MRPAGLEDLVTGAQPLVVSAWLESLDTHLPR
jgi:hypothetical protein